MDGAAAGSGGVKCAGRGGRERGGGGRGPRQGRGRAAAGPRQTVMDERNGGGAGAVLWRCTSRGVGFVDMDLVTGAAAGV